jgi:cyclic pyranopterin phosphate synthase
LNTRFEGAWSEVTPTQVDISGKATIYREATATGRIKLSPNTIQLIRSKKLPKGDPISTASTMAILGAKFTPSLIALCHQLKMEKTEPKITLGPRWVEVSVTVGAHEKTGVEMEALTAVTVGLLNVWDMVKAYEKDLSGQYPNTTIESVRVTHKLKGKP